MITANNITDQQIRDLREAVRNNDPDMHVTGLCKQALGEYECRACATRESKGFEGQCPQCANARSYARRRLAEMINEQGQLAADTGVTDDQIRALRDDLYRSYWAGDHSTWDAINLCRIALVSSSDQLQRAAARQRCADLIRVRDARGYR